MVLSYLINDDYINIFINITVGVLFVYYAYIFIYNTLFANHDNLEKGRNTDKLRVIRDEMIRLDLIEHLRDKIDNIQQNDVTLTDYNRINNYVNSIYDNIDTYMYTHYEYAYMFIMDLIRPQIYKFTT
jgi:hypothetical protein